MIVDSPNSKYSTIFKLGGWAALGVAFLTIAEIIAFMIFPQPDTISNWFILFQTKPLAGLIDFWGLEYPMYAAFIFVFLALYILLKDTDKAIMTIVLVLALLGAAIFFANSNPFTLLTLSRQHAAAETETQKNALLAAGEAVIALTNQRAIGGFNMALFLVSTAGLLAAFVVRKAEIFKPSTATIGLLAFTLSLADYVRQIFTQNLLVALPLIILGAIFITIWFTMIGIKLLKISQANK